MIMHCQKNKLYWNSESPASFQLYVTRVPNSSGVWNKKKKAKVENY